ncbi:hypothetical protein GCM10009745_24400 [Kribbella yunnanensis]|uniref:Uncharacterized protein n=1 Tax=Kribbella yunnanensis TaxID=190194 RepID=A0ABN2GZW6_9ACTN
MTKNPDDLDPAAVEEMLDQQFGGRWAVSADVPGLTAYVQLGRNDSGRLVLTGLLLMGDAIAADQLRKVPIAAIENAWNLSKPGDNWREEIDALPRLERSTGMAAEDFSQLVAQHYNAWARHVPHPAAAIAAEWGLKVPTVHTWIREARLRGLLPAAQRGKGGAR